MKTRSNMPLFVVECSDVKALSNSQIDLLRCGDYLVKKDESGEHAYKVTFKKEGVGMCLTYHDASVIETQSYDYVDGNWVYNSEDKTDLLAETTASDIDSGDATDGQVLMADGDGGASWESIPEPQATKMYLHRITTNRGDLFIYNTSSVAFTETSLSSFLNNNGFSNDNNMYPLNTLERSSNDLYIFLGAFSENGTSLKAKERIITFSTGISSYTSINVSLQFSSDTVIEM